MMLSTLHLDTMGRIEKKCRIEMEKPQAVIDYNCKAFIDLSNRKKAYNNTFRSGVKLSRKLALEFLLGPVSVNAHFLHSTITQRKITFTKFKEEILREILEVSNEEIAQEPQREREYHEFEKTDKRLHCVVCYSQKVEELRRQNALNKTPRST